MYIDSHTHFYSDQFDTDRDLAIKEAQKAGVEKFFLPAIDSKTTHSMLSLEKQYPTTMFPMMGLHPTSVEAETYKEELAHVKHWLDKRDFAAVGEIGIDLYWDSTFLKEQQEAFYTQITWAKEKKRPIVIHCRNAFDEVFEVLEEHKSPELYGIFHCFTGTKEQALQAIDYGMKLGIGGVVTFKNGKIDRFLEDIPLEHIVLETDAPYLAPTPFRGKRNESKYIPVIAEKLANIYGISPEKIGEITTQNSLSVFK